MYLLYSVAVLLAYAHLAARDLVRVRRRGDVPPGTADRGIGPLTASGDAATYDSIATCSASRGGPPALALDHVHACADETCAFRQNGTGVAGNDGCAGSLVQVGTPLVTVSGVYYLAISPSADEPRSGTLAMWNPPAASGQRSPDGPGAAGAITSWSGTGVLAASGANYTISITGALFCDSPVLVSPDTWGKIKLLYR